MLLTWFFLHAIKFSFFGWVFLVPFFLCEGTVVTASSHIITAVIGSGVLSLAWAIAQLGWVAGPAVLMVFSFITYFTSTLLADSYRSPDPITGKRNYTYMDVVRAHLGKNENKFFPSPPPPLFLMIRFDKWQCISRKEDELNVFD